MRNHPAIQNNLKGIITLFLAILFLLTSFIRVTPPAHAAVNVDTYAELKAACIFGGTINITAPIYIKDTINVSTGVTVTLVCAVDGHENTEDPDLIRHKDFHGNLFEVKDKGTLVIQCCIDGGAKDVNGNYQGFSADGNETSGYYGNSIINNYGSVILNSDKSVIKNNYNPYSKEGNWTYNGVTYPTIYTDTPVNGSAILNLNGSVTVSDGQIYSCVSDNGPAIFTAAGYESDKTLISGNAKIHNNVARQSGGAVFSVIREWIDGITDKYTDAKKYTARNTLGILNSTGSNAALTISENCKLYNNISKYGGGAVWNGHGGTLYMSGGEIYDNVSVKGEGGGICTNAGDIANCGNTNLCMGIPGGQTWISGGIIHNNSASSHGGGISVSDSEDYPTTDFDESANNIIKITGGSIHSNDATENGGGIYVRSNFVMNAGEVYKNSAENSGGGIYLTETGETSIVSGGEIYDNTSHLGGGIYSKREKGLTVADSKIYGNTATISLLNKKDPETGELLDVYYEAYGTGGGIYSTSSLTVNKSTKIYGNSAAYNGGGIYNSGNTEITDSSEIYQNKSLGFKAWETGKQTAGYGGGIYSSGSLSVNNASKLYENESYTYGGGIYVTGINSCLSLSESQIYSNITETGYGGGIFLSDNGEPCTVSKSKIFSNKAGFGGGISSKRINGLTVTDTEIYENKSIKTTFDEDRELWLEGYGGAIMNNGTLTINDSTKIHSNSADQTGGGIYNGSVILSDGSEEVAPKTNTLSISNCEISDNTAGVSGGGVYNASEFTLTESTVYNNSATANGGGICNTDTPNRAYSRLTVMNSSFSGNNAGANGGGIYFEPNGKTSSVSNSVFTKNTATSGGGIATYLKNGLTINGDTRFSENTASSFGGGILVYSGKLSLNNKITIDTNSAQSGGGVSVLGDGVLEINDDSKISDNVATGLGGGVYNYSTGSVYINNNAEISDNTAKNGGGICTQKGTVTFSSGNIFGNTAKAYGAGIYLSSKVDMTGGTIHSNKAAYSGGGVFIGANGVFDMRDGSIYSNTNGPTGDGVYVTAKSTFKMSKTAIVKEDDTVYLQDTAFIIVPELFTESQNVRAFVTGANLVPGRVIAKFGNTTDDLGSKALYHNTDELNMSEQYFVVKDKLLRSGDQGVADNNDAINKQDVFLTEKYAVGFDMNPKGISPGSTITHTIGTETTIFDDIENTHSYTKDYKYWYEPFTVADVGSAKASNQFVNRFLKWTLTENGTGTSYRANQKNIEIPVTTNENIIFYAQWDMVIDIDYNGNKATEGNNWTDDEIKVTAYGTYELSDNTRAFSRKETGADNSTKLFRFMGWSLDSKSRRQEYDFGEEVDYSILRSASKTIENRDKLVATVYAVWDEYPTIEAVDRWLTLDEIKAWPTKDNEEYEDFLKTILADFLSTASATDGAVGDVTDFSDDEIDGNEIFEVIDFDIDEFKKFKTSGNVTLTYRAVDKVGNETYKTVTVHIVDKAQQTENTVERCTRFISPKYFKNGEGNYQSITYGGINPESQWIKNAEYEELLTSTLNNTKNEETKKWSSVYETWVFTLEDIRNVKKYVEENGLGNAENTNALSNFSTQFAHCKATNDK